MAKPHFLGGRSRGAVRAGDFKLIEDYTTGGLELYDLKSDVGESKDLAKALPDVTARLHGKLKAWREEVGAKAVPHVPAKNPGEWPADIPANASACETRWPGWPTRW